MNSLPVEAASDPRFWPRKSISGQEVHVLELIGSGDVLEEATIVPRLQTVCINKSTDIRELDEELMELGLILKGLQILEHWNLVTIPIKVVQGQQTVFDVLLSIPEEVMLIVVGFSSERIGIITDFDSRQPIVPSFL